MSRRELEPGQLRVVAALLRSGMTARRALIEWAGASDVQEEALRSVGRRARLGVDIGSCTDPIAGPAARILAAILTAQARSGGDLALMCDRLADSLDERSATAELARAHAAGVHTSAHLVGWLPVAFLLLVPGARAPLADAVGVAMLVGGIGLTVAGICWIRRLLPLPAAHMTAPEAAALVCAAATRAGADHRACLRSLATGPGADPELRRAERRVRLGLTWGASLSLSENDGLRLLGASIRRSERLGVPLAATAERAVTASRAQERRRVEAESRRAAVRMVVPLTLCVLPAFVLLALGPHLRALV